MAHKSSNLATWPLENHYRPSSSAIVTLATLDDYTPNDYKPLMSLNTKNPLNIYDH